MLAIPAAATVSSPARLNGSGIAMNAIKARMMKKNKRFMLVNSLLVFIIYPYKASLFVIVAFMQAIDYQGIKSVSMILLR